MIAFITEILTTKIYPYALPYLLIIMAMVVAKIIMYRSKKPQTGVECITKERQFQKNIGFNDKHDDTQIQRELVQLGVAYASHGVPMKSYEPELWDGVGFFPNGWDYSLWNPSEVDPKDMTIDGRIRHLTIAGALMAAEIDRLERQKKKQI